MDNQNQTPQPVGGQPPVAQAQQPQMATAAPMPQPQQEPKPGGGKKLLYIILAVVLILLLGLGAYYYLGVNSYSGGSLNVTPTVIEQSLPQESLVPTVAPIQSSADLERALSQIDSTDTSAGIELEQNDYDSATFAP